MRTGIGYDIHKLVKGRKLVLGGVELESELGLEGHSDADVVVHSVCDALLGAASLGDIGIHFPDTDNSYKDVLSLKLLQEVKNMINGKNYEVNNIDITIICEKPRLSGYAEDMVRNISETLDMPKYDVNIKTTTNEGLGPVGKGEAIASMAVVTIIPTTDYGEKDN
ncbi:2-C-methyl-D-erythritol 2,4-cyclodiphosphate synthase [Elusimicrobiota bacterium]